MDIELWQIVVLAVIQGATEFLPISSSGHLVVVESMFLPEEGADAAGVNIVLHMGTLMSILVFYGQRVWKLLGEDRRTALLLIVATVPAVLVGIPLKMKFDALLGDALLAGGLLCATGVILLVSARIKPGTLQYQDLSWRQALLIGCAQAVAILPGLSRSGSTIVAGMRLGLAPRAAATFSFLLAIPAIGGAGLLEAIDLAGQTGTALPVTNLVIGALVAFVVGWASLSWLIRWIERGRLYLFAWWCIPVGLIVIVWQLSQR